MRKRTVNHVADTIFWYALYFLPVIAYLLYMHGSAKAGVVPSQNLDSFFNGFCDILLENPVSDSLYYIFASDEGIIPLFNDNAVYYFFSWFVFVYLVHLMIDFILFIPRFAHKWLKEFSRGDD